MVQWLAQQPHIKIRFWVTGFSIEFSDSFQIGIDFSQSASVSASGVGCVSCPGCGLASCLMLSPSGCILNARCKSLHASAETSIHSEDCPHQGSSWEISSSYGAWRTDRMIYLHEGALRSSCSFSVSRLIHSWISLVCVLLHLLFARPYFWIFTVDVTKTKCYDPC